MTVQALRSLRKSPAYSITAILTFGVGIGLTTAAFSLVNGFVLRPLPFPRPAELVTIHETSTTELCPYCSVGASAPIFAEWRLRARSFAALEAAKEEPFSVAGGDGPAVRTGGALVSAGLFPMLGVSPLQGRGLLAEDDRPGAAPVAVIAHEVWRTRFGGRPIEGQTIRINGVAHAVVGVMPDGFGFPEFARVWLPLGQRSTGWALDDRSLGVYGRLAPGITLAAARDEVAGLAHAAAQEHPATHQAWSATVTGLRDDLAGQESRLFWLLVGMVSVILLIACVNLAGVGLARGAARERELAVRVAIGAGRMDLIRLLMLETTWLAAAGGILGVVLALWAVDLARVLMPEDAPFWLRFDLDGRVFLFCAAATALAAVAAGLLPALRAARPDVVPALKNGTGATRDGRLRAWLVGAELALTLVLVIAAGLLTRTFARTAAFDPGYDVTGLMAADLGLRADAYGAPDALPRFAHALEDRLSRARGVRSSAVSHNLFLAGFGATDRTLETDAGPVPAGRSPRFAFAVTPSYFSTLGIAVTAGRPFTDGDRAGGEPVGIVNEIMAARVWPGASPLGQRVTLPDGRSLVIVGVAANVGGSPLSANPEARPALYVPFDQMPGRPIAVHVRSATLPLAVGPALVEAVAALDANEPVESMQSMEDFFDTWILPSRIAALLVGAVAIVALLLAAIGLYGVVAYTVGQRTREFGIRIAVGATAGQVLGLVLGQAAKVTLAGAAAGLAAAAAATQLMRAILFGTDPLDPMVFAASTMLLAAVMLAAIAGPARRAARVEPLAALRDD